ncbi:MAG: globin domain-containing protein [Ghiorsea sp.]|nr:globin domain-containing protein [Ghiorsea sp.]
MSFTAQQTIVKQHIESMGQNIDNLSSSFYTHLFRINPSLTHIFNGGISMLTRKFNNMLATFKSVHDLHKISAALESMAERHVAYHAEVSHFDDFNQALLLALEDTCKEDFTPELKLAWQTVFEEVANIMVEVLRHAPKAEKKSGATTESSSLLIDDIGGTEVVTRIHQRFYDYLYEDAYIGSFFHHRAKRLLVRGQTEFMVAAFGGENHYKGEPPAFIHMHMFITQEMSDIREIYLRRAILAEGMSDGICQRWLEVDRSFHSSLEKKSVDECVMRVWGQAPFTVKKPAAYQPPKS